AIISAAITIAPDLRDAITQSAVIAFPGFQDRIAAARPGGFDADEAVVQPVAGGLLPAARPPLTQEYVHPPAAQTRENALWDPLQPINRPLFAVYQFVDDVLVRPIALGYGWIVPGPIKDGVRNAFRNLDSPIVFANDLLQFQAGDAAVTLGRFILNSTVGGLGVFDVAARAGLPGHPSDFDQTLNFYHVPPGPYMVLPVIGPGTLRHNLARAVDSAADPLNWSHEVDNSIRIGRTVGYTIATRENLIKPLDTLRKDSLDWYATFRAAYYQDRAVVLRKGVTAPSAGQNDLFDAAQ
ncbi:MAG: VacJ family lipoprotein, partial [Alphaproteobacteria bacterium]